MWPWGHLAVGYLIYSVWSRARYRRAPTDTQAIVLLLGTQFPDLVDKPLAFWFEIFPEGRALAHSLLFAIPLLSCVWFLGRRTERTEVASAFALGYLSHLPGDAIYALVIGDSTALNFLLWPVLTVSTYKTNSFEAHLGKLLSEAQALNASALVTDPFSPFVLQIWLAGGLTLVWLVDGFPGPGILIRVLTN